MRSHYELLEVAPDAEAAVIKAAYRKLSRTLHPDMPTGSRALFGIINEAYEVLRDPRKRASYDQGLNRGERRSRAEMPSPQPSSPPSPPPPKPPSPPPPRTPSPPPPRPPSDPGSRPTGGPAPAAGSDRRKQQRIPRPRSLG